MSLGSTDGLRAAISRKSIGLLSLWMLLSHGGLGVAQQTTSSGPVVISLFPAGVRIGSETMLESLGRRLRRVSRVHVSGLGVSGAVDRDGRSETSLRIRFLAEPTAEPGYREVRLESPEGISNLALIRVDSLPQSDESEPNDTLETANRIHAESAVAGRLRQHDVDHFRVEAKAAERLTIEVEARRLGAPVAPVVSVSSLEGKALRQEKESRGIERDCRFRFEAPGPFIIAVRDSLFRGAEGVSYRLRVTRQPFATALFPLGGTRGKPLTVTASGSALIPPFPAQVLNLPDFPGLIVEPRPFPGGLLAPGRVVVGEGREFIEPADSDKPILISPGTTINGRLAHQREVDRYRLSTKPGDRLSICATASELGSWLDSVIVVRDATGRILAENDDTPPLGPRSARPKATDSRIDLVSEIGGDIVVEISDRYGEGGPEYGYRLEIGPPRPTFLATVILGRARGLDAPTDAGEIAVSADAFAMRQGQTAVMNIDVATEGAIGPITLTATGLPPGLSAEPVVVERRGTQSGRSNATTQLRIRAAREGALTSGSFEVLATAEPEGREVVRAVATATVAFDQVKLDGPGVPVARQVSRFWVKVVGP